MLKIEQLVPMVEQWGKDKGILDDSNFTKQLSKTKEEVYELIRDLTTPRDYAKISDSSGDTLVTLILYSKLRGINFLSSYNAVKEVFDKNEKITPRQLQKKLKKQIQEMIKINVKDDLAKIILCMEDLIKSCFQASYYINEEPEKSLEGAYNIIVKRKGKMVDGIFVREK